MYYRKNIFINKPIKEAFFDQIKEGEIKDLSVVLKADVQGSAEAIRDSLIQQATDEVRVRVIHEGTGGINEGDVMLAAASNAIIIGFNVRPDNKALEVVRREQVDVRFYNVIYDVVKDIRDALQGLLAPKPLLMDIGVKDTCFLRVSPDPTRCLLSTFPLEFLLLAA